MEEVVNPFLPFLGAPAAPPPPPPPGIPGAPPPLPGIPGAPPGPGLAMRMGTARQPKVAMKPLFWQRLQVSQVASTNSDGENLWKELDDADIDYEEVEGMFAKKETTAKLLADSFSKPKNQKVCLFIYLPVYVLVCP